MRLTIAGIVVLAVTLCLTPVEAQEQDSFKAGSLRLACSPPPTATTSQRHDADMICDAFMRGLTEGMQVMQVFESQGLKTCLPTDESVDRRDAIAILNDTLRTHPNMATNTAGVIMAAALLRAYACPGTLKP